MKVIKTFMCRNCKGMVSVELDSREEIPYWIECNFCSRKCYVNFNAIGYYPCD